MALPVFGAAGTYLTGGTRTTTSVPVPPGVTAGQAVVVHLYLESTTAVTPTDPAFTEVPGAQATSGPATVGRVFVKRATAADAGTYDFTHGAAFTEGVATRYTGVPGGGPLIGVSNSAQRSSAAGATPAVQVTTTGADRLLIWSATSVNTGPWTPPPGFTERVDTGREITVATAGQTTAGPSGAKSGTGPSDWMTAYLVALLPAVPAQTITTGTPRTAPAQPAPTIDQTPRIVVGAPPVGGVVPAPTVVPGAVDIVLGAPVTAAAPPPPPRLVAVIRPLPATATPTGSSTVYPPELTSAPRPPLRVDWWAHDDDGTLLCPLPHPVSWDLSLVPGEPGAVSLEYPRDGLHYDVLDGRVNRTRDLRIRIRIDGTHATSLGALLQARQGDTIAEGRTVTFHGRFLPWLLAEAPLPFNTDSERGEWQYPDGTAGSILRDVLAVVQAAGFLTDATWSFTDDHDSRGAAWSLQTSATFPPGRTVLEVAQKLRDWQMVEFEVVDRDDGSGGVEIRAYEPATVGTDHTATDPPVVLRRGRDLTEAPRRTDVSDAATALLIAGGDGVYVQVTDPAAEQVRGRKIGQYVSEGNLNTTGAATAYGALELSRRTTGVDEITHQLTFDPDQPAPLLTLQTLDWVATDTDTDNGVGVGSRERIAQITVTRPAGQDHYRGGVVLRDLIASRDLAVQRQLDGLAGGQIVTGVSTPAPSTDDGKTPGQVAGVAVTSEAYPAEGATKAAARATWLALDRNDDNSPLTDLDHYEVDYRYTGGAGLPQEWVRIASTRDTDAAWDGLVAGAPIAVRVRALDRFGRAGAWSTPEVHVLAADATPPPTLSAPDVDNYLGLLRIVWDGLDANGLPMPSDFDAAEILASETDDFDPATDPYTVVAQLRGAQTYAWSPPGSLGNADYGITWFVKLRGRDTSGLRSVALSAQGSAVPGQVEEGDVASVNVGVLTSGISTAIIQNAGIVRSAPSGYRYELDAYSLRFYNQAEEVTFEGGGPDGSVRMVGELTTGFVGRRIRIGGTNNRIEFFPQVGETRKGVIQSFIPTNYPDDISVVMTSSDADSTDIKGWMEVRPDIALAAVVKQAATSISTAQVAVNDHRVTVTAHDDNGDVFSILRLQEDQLRLEQRDPLTGDRDGGYVFLGRGDSGAVSMGKQSSGVNSYVTFPDTGNLDFYRNGLRKLRLIADGAEITPYAFTNILGGIAGGTVQIRLSTGQNISFRRFGSDANVILDHPGIGSGASYIKNFVVDHPTDPDRWLIHACTEGPVAGVEYSGVVVVDDVGGGDVELPAYFEAFTRAEGRQVFVQAMLDDPPGGRATLPWLPRVVASYPRDGGFRIATDAPPGTRVAWLVKAVRADVPDLLVEPRRSDVVVHGEGPYRYYETGDPS